ncbi:hypothetical protein HC762_01260 [bacterium]|nr:hypothetical protein [bacterium]
MWNAFHHELMYNCSVLERVRRNEKLGEGKRRWKKENGGGRREKWRKEKESGEQVPVSVYRFLMTALVVRAGLPGQESEFEPVQNGRRA